MLKRFLSGVRSGQRGITGLETAIILIAFVVVAAVFAYTVLSAGLFSTQKSSEAVYSGIEETQSTLELDGAVIAFEGNANKVGYIKFTVSNALGGEPINFTAPTDDNENGGVGNGLADSDSTNVVTISYIDKYQRYDDLAWSVTKLGNCDSDNLLENDEKFEITVPGTTAGTNDFEAVLSQDLTTQMEFTIEVKPPNGAVLPIERTIPDVIDAVMNLN